jgi:hypothetical protein
MKAKPGELRNVVGNSGVVAIKVCTIINNVVWGRLPYDPYWKMTREQQFARRSGDGRGAGRGLKMASGAGADMEVTRTRRWTTCHHQRWSRSVRRSKALRYQRIIALPTCVD